MSGEKTANNVPDVEWGSFSVRQGGVTVASGSGPYEAMRREALHYGAVYSQDGQVRVTIRRLKPRRSSQ